MFVRTRPLVYFLLFAKDSPPHRPDQPGGEKFRVLCCPRQDFRRNLPKCVPPARAQLRPLRPKAVEQSRAQAGGQRERLRRNTYPGQRKTRSVSDFRSWPSAKKDKCFRLPEKVKTAFMAGLKNPHTCSIPAVVASVMIFESCCKCEDF